MLLLVVYYEYIVSNVSLGWGNDVLTSWKMNTLLSLITQEGQRLKFK